MAKPSEMNLMQSTGLLNFTSVLQRFYQTELTEAGSDEGGAKEGG